MKEHNVIVAFAVNATTVAEFTLDVTGMSDAEIIEAVDAATYDHIDTSVCHQCGHNVSDPEAGDMTGLTVGGREIDLEARR